MFQNIKMERLPPSLSAEKQALGRDRFTDAVTRTGNSDLQDQWTELQERESLAGLLGGIFEYSPFLTSALCRQPAFSLESLERDPSDVVSEQLEELRRPPSPDEGTPALMKRLRQVRERVAILAALADIAGIWPLENVTTALSDLADASVQATVGHLLLQAERKGEIALPATPHPCDECGLTVLAMGKHGARELNYSSDIDLVLLFDQEKVDYRGKDAPQTTFSRIARNLVKILSERTADGHVFRVDLRLRPDPASTPPAISVAAAETYYEAMGQNWERAAMIKARVCAGDRHIGEDFLRFIKPFIWRKNLDFASIEDIHSIKRQIDRHYGGSEIAVAGHDVKLGRGGIREIEFFVQTQQLIWGGRLPELQDRPTLPMLYRLVEFEQVTAEAARDMEDAYRFLRMIEHRLQMIDDAQTHKLPTDEDALERFAAFAGFNNLAELSDALTHELQTVEKHYSGLFETSQKLGSEGSLVFTGVEDDPETLDTMARMGFSNTPSVSETIRNWHRGRYRATRSTRTKQYLTELMPRLLKGFSKTANPDLAFFNFDRFLGKLPAGVQLFAMFHTHPELLDIVAEIMGGAPRLADQLSRRPDRLESLLDADFRGPPPELDELIAECREMIGRARFFEEVLDLARRWAGDWRFQIGLRIMRGQMTPMESGPALSNIAEAVLRALLPAVEDELAIRHGHVPGGAVMLLGMGKLGSRELMPGSDLDLILVYDAPPDVTASDGEKPLAISTYYSRLCQRLVNALTVLTGEGTLYEIDLRLRPSGNKGPLACSLDSFVSYQMKDAWTWEHMALTRARPVAGDDTLCQTVSRKVNEILSQPRDGEKLLRDVAVMRRKMADELDKGSPWDIKQSKGGIVDSEFIVQYLLLRDAPEHPVLGHIGMIDSVGALARSGALTDQEAALLMEASSFWQGLQAVLRIAVQGEFKPDQASEGLKRLILRAMDAPSLEVLEAHMLETASTVHDLYNRIVASPAEALGDPDQQNDEKGDTE